MKTHTQLADGAEILECANAADWEAWLAQHYGQPGGVWLKIAKKNSKMQLITISDALGVALCYGWIDSQRKGYNQDYYLQRYSPRRPKSPWSRINVEKAETLTAAGRMQKAGLLEIAAAKKDGRWNAAYASQRNISIPPDLERSLAENRDAKKNFEFLDKTGQYAIILPILKATTSERRKIYIQKAMEKLTRKVR